jgi:hypothetical protein
MGAMGHEKALASIAFSQAIAVLKNRMRETVHWRAIDNPKTSCFPVHL